MRYIYFLFVFDVGTAFCGNSPIDTTLLSLVHNEVLHLSSGFDTFACQYEEQKKELESQFLDVKQSLAELMKLGEKVEEMEYDMQNLKRQVADLSRTPVKAEREAKIPMFFGALNRNECFTGRIMELEVLEKAFRDTGSEEKVGGVAARKVNVRGICGLGGCGKSSLAVEFAWRNLAHYPGGVFVVNGESDDFIRESFCRICGALVDDLQCNQLGEAKQFEWLFNKILLWLGKKKDKWLLIVDNMDQQDLSHCARTLFFGQWKNNSFGDILVTSRKNSQALSDDLDVPSVNCFELSPFSLDESVEFLMKRTGVAFCAEDQKQEVNELAQELGGLPLALEQAAAYIKALNCSVELYLQQYRCQKSILLDRKTAKPCTEIYSEARLTVKTTWLLNFSYIENIQSDPGLGQAAALIMKVAAYLSPDDIPIEFLNIGAPEVEHEELKERLQMPIGVKQIVDLLINFSLFKRKSSHCLCIHRLVQETLRDRCDSEGETEQIFSSAIRMMHRAFLDCVGGTDFLHDLCKSLASQKWKENCHAGRLFQLCYASLKTPSVNGSRWQTLSANAFHFGRHFWCSSAVSNFNAILYTEQSARVFCEVAYYFYVMGNEIAGYYFQQLVLDIICAIREPLRFYKGDEITKITRMLCPFDDVALLSVKFGKSSNAAEEDCDRADIAVNTNDGNELLKAIKLVEPKAREAFSRGDFQSSVHLYSDIVKMSNHSGNIPGAQNVKQSHLVPLGEIFCNRGIAHLKMGNFVMAADDFNEAIRANTEHYRGYYWKAYAFCKLVETGGAEFTSRAQAAAAVLHYKFSESKWGDIKKLQRKFPGLLDQIEYKVVSQVCELKELERLSAVQNDSANHSLTIILDDGVYVMRELVLIGGHYYFVCLPGNSGRLMFMKGLRLEQGSFLFENVEFGNIGSLLSAFLSCERTENEHLDFPSEKFAKERISIENVDTSLLQRECQTHVGSNPRAEQELSSLIEANDVLSLAIDHCAIEGSLSSGIEIAFSDVRSTKKKVIMVRSSRISLCRGAGLQIQGDTNCSRIIVCGNDINCNLYGAFIDSPSCLELENNTIVNNCLSGIVVARISSGRLLGNSLMCNGKHGVLFNDTNTIMVKNIIRKNRGWGTVCSCETNVQCKENVFESNLCGGLRVIFNGDGKVLIQECDFTGNCGPDIFPLTQNELSRMERKWKQFLSTFVLSFFTAVFFDGTAIKDVSGKFNSPSLVDNRVLESGNTEAYVEQDLCSACYKCVNPSSDLVMCPTCNIARYCSQQCLERAKAIHCTVCNFILEGDKEYVNCEMMPLGNVTLPVQGDCKRAGNSLCVIATVSFAPIFAKPHVDLPGANYPIGIDPSTTIRLCLLSCPRRRLWTFVESPGIHHFISRYGSHLPDRMLDTKAACILARFDSESRITAVFKHRIFTLETIPGALNWVNRTLDAFEERNVKKGT